MRGNELRSLRIRRLLIILISLVFSIVLVSCSEAGAGGGGGTDPGDDDSGVVRPSAFFVVTPNPNTGYVTIFQEMLFDAGGSDSNVPGRPITRYRWDFSYASDDGFDPQQSLGAAQTEYMYKRFREEGFVVGLVVEDAEGVESDVFVRHLWIEDREGGILVVE